MSNAPARGGLSIYNTGLSLNGAICEDSWRNNIVPRLIDFKKVTFLVGSLMGALLGVFEHHYLN